LDREVRVCELIDKELHEWNKELLEALFNTEEVKATMSIPLSSTNRSDAIIWRGIDNRIFTVKSAYHMVKEREKQLQTEGSRRGVSIELWGSLWQLKIPNAEKNFLWRACQEILPTKANMCKRKIISDARCPICELDDRISYPVGLSIGQGMGREPEKIPEVHD
jgi:hypothetical protein